MRGSTWARSGSGRRLCSCDSARAPLLSYPRATSVIPARRFRHTRAPLPSYPRAASVIPARRFRHTRACRGYLAVAARSPAPAPCRRSCVGGVGWGVGDERGLGAEHGEIPAASAGMTDLFRAGMTDLLARGWRTPCSRGGGGACSRGGGGPLARAGVAELARAGVTELARAGVADPLLAWGSGEAWTGLGAQRGEIPAASAGMTDLLARGWRSLLAWGWRVCSRV